MSKSRDSKVSHRQRLLENASPLRFPLEDEGKIPEGSASDELTKANLARPEFDYPRLWPPYRCTTLKTPSSSWWSQSSDWNWEDYPRRLDKADFTIEKVPELVKAHLHTFSELAIDVQPLDVPVSLMTEIGSSNSFNGFEVPDADETIRRDLVRRILALWEFPESSQPGPKLIGRRLIEGESRLVLESKSGQVEVHQNLRPSLEVPEEDSVEEYDDASADEEASDNGEANDLDNANDKNDDNSGSGKGATSPAPIEDAGDQDLETKKQSVLDALKGAFLKDGDVQTSAIADLEDFIDSGTRGNIEWHMKEDRLSGLYFAACRNGRTYALEAKFELDGADGVASTWRLSEKVGFVIDRSEESCHDDLMARTAVLNKEFTSFVNEI